jgi:hypothetical protein
MYGLIRMDATTTSANETAYIKFIPFVKMDATKREVSGIVTAEQPDKDREVCDYEKSKPYYKAWSDELNKATDGKNLGNLREMHQLTAVGKGIDLQFHDADKEIVMTFKVVDDNAWKKVEEGVYTGFSQGGRKVGNSVPDPMYKGCHRYVANPSEVSLVDNPCLPSAHFAYVKTDGSVEMRKFTKTEVPSEINRVAILEEQVAELRKAAGHAPAAPAKTDPAGPQLVKKTKQFGGKDLEANNFAYVADPEKPETWKLPLCSKAAVRQALASYKKSVPDNEKTRVYGKILSLAKTHGVDIATEDAKLNAIRDAVRKSARVFSNTHKVLNKNVASLDIDLGKFRKGMWEVSTLAMTLDEMAMLVYMCAAEQDYELDEDSELPEMLATNVEDLTRSLLAMVEEETRELLAHVKERVA